MLLKLSEHISTCLERAASAEERALQMADPASRSDNELLAESWRQLARSYQLVESLNRFLSEPGRNKKGDLPPEMLAALQQQPGFVESKPVTRRPRIKHESSFNDRLLKTAQDAREQASQLPAGPERDRLLMKAQQCETAAGIETWVSLPGKPPPDNLGGLKPRE